MKSRECPYCHHTISIKRCLKYLLLGTNHATQCNHCNRSVKLEKEPIPFHYCVIAGFISMVAPMELFLYVGKLSFGRSLLYSLPFVLICILIIAILTLRRIYFKGNI